MTNWENVDEIDLTGNSDNVDLSSPPKAPMDFGTNPDEPTSTNQSTGTKLPSIIEIDDLEWAVGLEWQVSSQQNLSAREARTEARKLATNEEFDYAADLLCVSKTASQRPEYGFGKSELGHENGQPTLAPLVAGHLAKQDGDTVVVVEINGGRSWWILSLANGAIHTDAFCQNEADAREVCQELANNDLMFWKEIHAPLHWSLGSNVQWTEQTLQDVVENYFDSSVTLQPVGGWGWVLAHYLGGVDQISKKQIALISAAALVVIGLYGHGWYQDYVEQQHLEELRRQAALAAAGKPNDLPKRDPVWAKAPSPSLAINTCVNGISTLIGAVPGWDQKSISCVGAIVSAEYEKTEGSISEFFAVSKAANWPQPSFDDSGNSATVSINIDALWPRGDQALLPPEYLKPVIADFFQRSRHSITASDQKDHLTLNWKSLSSPTDWASALDKLPGAVLDRLEFNPGTYEWTFNMRVFAWQPPPLPPQPS